METKKAKCERCGNLTWITHWGRVVSSRRDMTARPVEWLCQNCSDKYLARLDKAIARLEESLKDKPDDGGESYE